MANVGPMRFRIPDPHKQLLKELGELPSEAVDKLDEALGKSKPAFSAVGLVSQLEGVESISATSLRGIVTVLLSLALTREIHEVSLDQLVEDVSQAASREGLIGDTDQAREMLKERLSRLLSHEVSVGVSSRAQNLILENERTFLSSRIVSDVRPLFAANTSAEPVAAVVVHNLRIESRSNGDNDETFFALDSEDLRKLRAVIERAILKEEALQQIINKADLHYISITE